jgi:hypothetical protein
MSTLEKVDGLVTEAREFLIGGGTLSRTEWEVMDAEERTAHVQAGKELRLEAAVLAGLASVKLEPNLNGGSGAIAGVVRSLVEAARTLERRGT